MIAVEGTVPFPATDPGAVSAFGTNVASLVTALHGASGQLSSVTTTAAAAWQGQAATAFQQHMATETAAITSLAAQLTRVQPAITTYAGKMTAAETAYNAAVQKQMAAIAEGPGGVADEALAIAQEAAALAELEAAGVVCAATLTGVAAALVAANLKGLSSGDLVELAADAVKDLTHTASETIGDMTKVVAGYTRKTGTVVESYVRYAEGFGAKYASQLKASTLREAGEVAEKISGAAKFVSGIPVALETVERDRELVKAGVPEPYAATEAVIGRVGPSLAGAAAGDATIGAIETAGTAGGAVAGSEVPVAGTAAGAVAGAVAVSVPALAAGAAVDLGVSKGTQFGADWVTDRINEMAFHVKPEGSEVRVGPPTH